MCEERETPLADLLTWAKKALTNPALFCQFVEETEHISKDLFYMPVVEKEAYQAVWWDMQEVHLTLYPVWEDIDEPQNWVGLEAYQQSAIQAIQKLTHFCIEHYLKTLQHIIDSAHHAINNKELFERFVGDMYSIEERLDFLSEGERVKVSCLQSTLELAYCYVEDDSLILQWNGGWGTDKHKVIVEYQEFVDFLIKHKQDIEEKYLIAD